MDRVTQLCDLSDFDDLEIVEPWKTLFRNELAYWHSWYLPAKGTILDLGAGCGETARFFLNHGAEKVICVEYDPIALSHLKRNFGSDERVIIVPEKIGKIKMDIEGGEWGTVIESHDSYPTFRRLFTASTTSVCVIEPQRRLSFGHIEQRLRRLITLQGAWRRKHLRMRKRTMNQKG